MTPLPIHIPCGEDLLLGQYQAAAPAAARAQNGLDAPAPAVLLCNPFGQEAIRCHRAFRLLAARLASSGMPSVRFDYFGTGDSPGNDGEGDVSRWKRDIAAAHQALLVRSGSEDIVWLGLRLGGCVALEATALVEHAPTRIVLWDPVIDGVRYLEALAHRHAFWTRRQGVIDEALGFQLPQRLRAQIAAIDLAAMIAATSQPIAVVIGAEVDGSADFLQRMAALRPGASVAIARETTEWCSNEAMGTQWVPGEALERLVDFVHQASPRIQAA
jgi:pimeloyl-ACP methyl ester carboxylesterase